MFAVAAPRWLHKIQQCIFSLLQLIWIVMPWSWDDVVTQRGFHNLKINKSNFIKIIKETQIQDVLKCHKVVLHDKVWPFLPLQDVFRKGLSGQSKLRQNPSICTDELFFIYMVSLPPKLVEGIYKLPCVHNANLCFSAVLSMWNSTPTEQ